MLKLVYHMEQLSFGQLMEVYREGNEEKAREDFPDLPLGEGILMAEQEFYQYLREVFFPSPQAVYALWLKEELCVSALRLEPYRDGLLLTALETRPDCRRIGYGKALVQAVVSEFDDFKIYSHVSRNNVPSLRLHESCGFRRAQESATYLDGSVSDRSRTLVREKACIL